jgi:hypothetical protein
MRFARVTPAKKGMGAKMQVAAANIFFSLDAFGLRFILASILVSLLECATGKPAAHIRSSFYRQ